MSITGLPEYFVHVVPPSLLYAMDWRCTPVAFTALVYTATSGPCPPVPSPLVFDASSTTLPDHTSSVASIGMAIGSSVQCARSVLTACPQDALPPVFPSGLYW